ncbi:MAG: 30S ribosomal protein S20 [Candidatus Marinimicrobia bacterium]|nr:30S ribosomal protein S20 [Candidatus Neomarinimicrobiota bacterium]
MARTKSVQKRIRQAEKARKRNRHFKTLMKNKVKKFMAIEDKEKAKEAISETVSVVDKMVTKGIIHKNKAAREKSKLARHLRNLS